MVIAVQTMCITIKLQIFTDNTVWIISREVVSNKTFRNMTFEIGGAGRYTSLLARTRTYLSKLLNMWPLLKAHPALLTLNRSQTHLTFLLLEHISDSPDDFQQMDDYNGIRTVRVNLSHVQQAL